jgi:hypothetical protein
VIAIFRAGKQAHKLIGGEPFKMNLRNKIIGVALVAALLGGSVGAIVSRSSSEPANASLTAKPSSDLLDQQDARQIADNNESVLTARNSENVDDASSYRAGFLDGFQAAQQSTPATRSIVTATAVPASRVVYRNAPVRRYSRASNSRQVYYDYNQPQPRKRSFWQKHRDKLTVAMGAGGGALIGSLIGGKKGAAIGALSGGGGAALYTYVLRKRNRNY